MVKTHLTTHIPMATLTNNNSTLTLNHFNTRVTGNDSVLMEVLTIPADQDICYRLSHKSPVYAGYLVAMMAGTLDIASTLQITRMLNPLLPFVKEIQQLPIVLQNLHNHINNIEHRRVNLLSLMKILGLEEHIWQCIAERAQGVPANPQPVVQPNRSPF